MCEGLLKSGTACPALARLMNGHKQKAHTRLCDAVDATLVFCIHPVRPILSSSISFFLPFPQIVRQKNTLHICQGPFFPLLSSSWLAVDSMSPRIFAEDSFHIMEKSGCCLLSFPIIPRSSCFSHLLYCSPKLYFLPPPYMVKMHPSLFACLPVLSRPKKKKNPHNFCLVCVCRPMSGCRD